MDTGSDQWPDQWDESWYDDGLGGLAGDDMCTPEDGVPSGIPIDDDTEEPASPFSIAVTAAAATVGIQKLRDLWRRRRESEDLAPQDGPQWWQQDGSTSVQGVSPNPEPSTVQVEDVRGPDDDQPGDRVAAERTALIWLCIELDDLLTNEAQRHRLRRGLRGVGVDVVDPDGQPFDADRHRAVGRERPTDATGHDRIATVERVGFRDRGRELRPPEVVVYNWDEDRDAD